MALQFDGIFRDARVWVNGFLSRLGAERICRHKSTTYPEYLNYGGENVVAVRADATLEEGSVLRRRGIYRHVWLDKTDNLHVAPFGTFVSTDLKAPYDEKPL